MRFWQEIYDDQGELVEIHEKFPLDRDVRAFGLTWDDCEDLPARLGYTARVEIQSQFA